MHDIIRSSDQSSNCVRVDRKKKQEEEKNNDEWVPSIILYRNRFGGLKLGAAVGVKAKKNKAPKSKESTQIKSRGLVLGLLLELLLGVL